MNSQIRCAHAASSLIAIAGCVLPALGVGGNTPADTGCANINNLGGLPFEDTGDTSGVDCNGFPIGDTFQFDCDQGEDEAGDVFYAYTAPPTGINLYIETCGSENDTKIYVLDDSLQLVACNDDAPDCLIGGGEPFASRLECVALEPNQLYFIGVDGFFQSEGPYQLLVRQATADECEVPPCPECPPGGTPEGEACFSGSMGQDNDNGGCDVSPPAFTAISCNETICGSTYFDSAGFRDTDWFQIDTSGETEPRVFTLTGNGESPIVIGLIAMEAGFEGSGDCARDIGINPFAVSTEPCSGDLSVTTDALVPGIHWFFVAHSFFGSIVDCADAEYTFTVGCEVGPTCPEDVDGDGSVGFTDLLRVIGHWGPCE